MDDAKIDILSDKIATVAWNAVAGSLVLTGSYQLGGWSGALLGAGALMMAIELTTRVIKAIKRGR